MAEILGVVASGISVAQLAGQIIATGIKVKGFLDEISDAPETLSFLVGQIQVLAPVLCEFDDVHHSMVASESLKGSLQAAVLQCQKALEHLESLSAELHTQIQTSTGFRQKLRTAKVLLKKEQLLKHERRLSMAVQLLALAQQTYML